MVLYQIPANRQLTHSPVIHIPAVTKGYKPPQHSMNNHPKCTDNNVEEAAAENVYNEILSKVIIEVACGVHRAAKTGVLPYSNIMLGPVNNGAVSEENEDGVGNNGRIHNEAGTKDSESGINDGDGVAAAGNDSDTDTTGNIIDAGQNKVGSQKEGNAIKYSKGQGLEMGSNEELGHGEGYDAKKTKLQFSQERQSTITTNSESTILSSNITDKHTATIPDISPKKSTDIYGRTPGKEPKYTIPCPNNCGRQISSSRMALHLENFLGISSGRRISNNPAASGNNRRGNASASTTSSVGKGNGVSKGGKASRQGKQAKRKSSKMV